MDALLSEEFYAENFVFIDICYPDLSEYMQSVMRVYVLRVCSLSF